MRHIHAAILTAAVFAISCSNAPKYCNTLAAYQAGEPSALQERRLHCAYREDSQPRLRAFVSAWVEASQPKAREEQAALAAPIRHANTLLEDFYSPHRLDHVPAFHGSSQGVTFADQGCIPIRNAVEVEVRGPGSDGGPAQGYEPFEHGLLAELRPQSRSDVDLCYLDAAYRNLFERFLLQEAFPAGTGDETLSAGERQRRSRFLQQQTAVFRDPFGESRPTIDVRRIAFNSTLTMATLAYRRFGEGGVARYERADGDQWTLVEIEVTWAE